MTYNNQLPETQSQSVPAYSAPPAIEHPWRAVLIITTTLLLTVGLVVLVPADAIERMGQYGYLGVFVLTLLASASIFLPSPALAAALLAGKALSPWMVGVLAGVGAGLGEIASYVAGYGGSELATHSRYYSRVACWVQQWGMLTIFTLSVIPSPVFFDLAGIAAGTMRMPFYRFLLACIVGKMIRFTALAWLGRAMILPL